ncbi:hypothetical protein [Enhydrobacter sp.]|jgi:hypothetical protein|uniref:hypothetical protein n=1 Tax=Enhydrobacter sp. TaxID=1894999 RepID=UPI0026131A00|nr:hypothetical protein [Enhydrobacter sp.]
MLPVSQCNRRSVPNQDDASIDATVGSQSERRAQRAVSKRCYSENSQTPKIEATTMTERWIVDGMRSCIRRKEGLGKNLQRSPSRKVHDDRMLYNPVNVVAAGRSRKSFSTLVEPVTRQGDAARRGTSRQHRGEHRLLGIGLDGFV